MMGDDSGTFGDDANGDGSMMFGDSGNPTGDATGPAGCDPTCMQAGGTCKNGICGLTDNAGNLDPGTQNKLQGGGNADSGFKWLYPYDKTVFPRGLIPPTMQLDGIAADTAYVHMSCPTLDYNGYFKVPPGPTRIALAQPMWDAVVHAVGAKDLLTVQVTKMSGGLVTGPVKEQWSVAQGSLRGTIYYETYDSQLAGGFGSVGIMQIQPGAKQPVVLKTGCGNVCHTASADGSTLVASNTLTSSVSYDLKNAAAVIHQQVDESFTYGGIYPDGSFVMSATHYRTWFPGTLSKLYDTKTGANIHAPGWDGTVQYGGTTAFSPDGKRFAFVHEDAPESGHTISVMDFKLASHTFSNMSNVANDPNTFLGWPAFTPDGGWVVYHADSNAQFETDSGAVGDVYIVDVATRTVHRLDALDGFEPNGNTYLPANDPHLTFAPTVLPEAVGGYYWVVFTSHRSYGNSIVTQDNMDEYGKLWVAALDINPTPGKDASYPAFYLDGQETHADNLRGFWVLPPCKQNSSSCMSGDDCCGGFCRSYDGGGTHVGAPPGGCSNEFEKCTTAAYFFNSGYQ
jgi:hypothetical protein